MTRPTGPPIAPIKPPNEVPTSVPTGPKSEVSLTLSPPSLLVPSNNATIPLGQPVILQWATVHPLTISQNYLVLITDLGTGATANAVTRSNTYRLPDNMRPGAGQTERFQWQVVVIEGANPNASPISGQDVKWDFTWGP